jgi:hypothetical protein
MVELLPEYFFGRSAEIPELESSSASSMMSPLKRAMSSVILEFFFTYHFDFLDVAFEIEFCKEKKMWWVYSVLQ